MQMSFRYFSGFCLENESELFSEYLIRNDFTITGFSYGAIKAFEYALKSTKRVDTLQLFSPAFFHNFDKKEKRLQLMFFKKNSSDYMETFLKNIAYPSNMKMYNYLKAGTYEELDELLNYTWDKEKLEMLLQRGIKIEVYLGAKDKIIDANSAKEFFKEFATVYYIKDKGHIL
ncbi:hypothetical protein CRV07_10330 [Halarcobacter ebronensis]|uniref:Alpha/beta hydrolase n=2 Tax=Halarcobacter ebronensis TaxID=1462615 RepID=A0A4Q1AMC2_9BACT|nr:hypothetical protein CRV07_10330 [Halarcobacter ebronensis]